MVQCGAVWCSAICRENLGSIAKVGFPRQLVWGSRHLQCGAVWCSVVECGAVWCSDLSGELGFEHKGGFPTPIGMGFTSFAVWCSMVQCGTVYCSVLQCVAVIYRESLGSNFKKGVFHTNWYGVHVSCKWVQCIAVFATYCCVLQRVATCCSMFPAPIDMGCTSIAVYYSVLQCVAVYCSVLQCVAVWCSVLQHVALGFPRQLVCGTHQL